MKTIVGNMKFNPKIGIVSGVGPLAGSDLLAKVFKNAAHLYGAVEDNQYPDLILLNHGIKGFDNTATLNDNFKNEIIESVQKLESQGANVIGIACNTAHAYLHKIKINKNTKLINLIDAVAHEASKHNVKYLLLTSNGSKQQKLYHPYLKKYGVNFVETSEEMQGALDSTIGLVMAHKLDEAGKVIERVLSEAETRGFRAIIAGCTELPIAIDHCKSKNNIKIIDSNQVLAQRLTANYYSSNNNLEMDKLRFAIKESGVKGVI